VPDTVAWAREATEVNCAGDVVHPHVLAPHLLASHPPLAEESDPHVEDTRTSVLVLLLLP
jgi:hypothetical protein